jgi:formate dehydrogenase iron-sulfur subunit
MCSTKSLLAGDGEVIGEIYHERVAARGYGSGTWGWGTAYGDGDASAGAVAQGDRNQVRAGE